MARIFNMMLGYRRGGVERMAAVYHRMLAAEGHDVTTIGHPQGWVRDLLPEGADFIGAAPLSAYDPRLNAALRRHVREARPDIILAHSNRAQSYAVRLDGVLRVAVQHNFRLKKRIRRLDGLIAVSPEIGEAVRRRFGTVAVEVVPNALDITPVAERPPRRKPIVIGAIGRLHGAKGFDVLIRALATPGLASRDWRLVVGGEGPELGALQSLAKRLGLADRITFSGWISDVSGFFSAIDLYVMPSRLEPFGLTLIEALAAAVPTVVTDTSGTRDIVRGREVALVVPLEDPEATGLAIRRLIEDEALAVRLGEAGRRYAASAYGPQTIGPVLSAVVGRFLASSVPIRVSAA
ncbi:glycosyltransferase [Labrys wisconsinensis]|uniref:Glycosyltransferase involved in cell wall biosynthesis n=1 Tax=Labrys wisconsinensis TaxID=425677 RepID=A0ABU0J267_9HYPH|nr:glycosyltransferase [Labrys wisconsinensis]MDQ0468353.1 glycosyltransferase involved in cell wall biosynthesis [Labrys wisconsinensis]